MTGRRSNYDLQALLASGRGDILGLERARLPLPPLLMFDRIGLIAEDAGLYGKGQVVASLKVAENPGLDWIFSCHFRDDPVMPGSLGLEALWQLTGFYLGWLGIPGKGRALGVDKVRFTRAITPEIKSLGYAVDIKRVVRRRLTLVVADGTVTADDQVIYTATNLMAGLFQADSVDRRVTAPPN